jgi:hypothetical protein
MKSVPYPDEARKIHLDFQGPRWTPAHEVQWLIWKCLSMHSATGPVVEIGCNEGRTLRELAMALPDRLCVGVDCSSVASMCAQQSAERPPVGRVGFYARDLSNVVVIDCHPTKVWAQRHYWRGSLGLIFIDGDHSFEGVREDTEHALHRIQRLGGGTIAWHDCYPEAPAWCSVYSFLEDLSMSNNVYRVEGSWLAYLDL